MPQIKKNATLPSAAMPEPEYNFTFDEATNKLTVTLIFDFDYPDEAVHNRYGRLPKDKQGNPTGEPKPITQRTYGRAHKVFTGSADAFDKPMFLNARLWSPADAEEDEGTEDTE